MPLLETRGSGSALGYGLNSGIQLDRSTVVMGISGLRTYVDARSGYTSTQWTDLSNNGNHFIPVGNPTYTTVNGRQTVQFRSNPAQGAYCVNQLDDGYPSIEVYFSVEGQAGANQILYNKEDTYEFSTGASQFQWAWQAEGSSWEWVTVSGWPGIGTKVHLVQAYDTDLNLRTYVNGSLVQTNGAAIGNAAIRTADDRWPKINGRNNAQTDMGDPGNHNIYRFTIWNRALNQSEVTSLRNDAVARHGS
jgi:hypothetical protein